MKVNRILYFRRLKIRIKRATYTFSVYLGLSALIVTLLIPAMSNIYFERPHKVYATENNLQLINFQNDWSLVQKKLQLSTNTKLDRFNLQYNADGSIRDLHYELVDYVNRDITYYTVRFNPATKVYIIKPQKVEQWGTFERYPNKDTFIDIGGVIISQIQCYTYQPLS